MLLVIESIPYRFFLKAKIADMLPSFAKMSRKKIMLHSYLNCNKDAQISRHVHVFYIFFNFLYILLLANARNRNYIKINKEIFYPWKTRKFCVPLVLV